MPLYINYVLLRGTRNWRWEWSRLCLCHLRLLFWRGRVKCSISLFLFSSLISGSPKQYPVIPFCTPHCIIKLWPSYSDVGEPRTLVFLLRGHQERIFLIVLITVTCVTSSSYHGGPVFWFFLHSVVLKGSELPAAVMSEHVLLGVWLLGSLCVRAT